MFIKYPEFSYKPVVLDGYSTPEGENPLAVYAGETLTLNVELEGVDLEKYIVYGELKVSPKADVTPVWTGLTDFGISSIPDKPGIFTVTIQAPQTATFLPGIYYLILHTKEKIGAGGDGYEKLKYYPPMPITVIEAAGGTVDPSNEAFKSGLPNTPNFLFS